MNDIKSIKDIWKKLMYILTDQQKKYGIIIFVLSIIGALFETLGVSIIVPFMQAMVNPEKILSNSRAYALLDYFDMANNTGLIVAMCICVCIVYLVKNVFLIGLSWARAKYSCKIMREISIRVMRSYMKRPYQFYLQTNMGDLSRGTSSDPAGVYAIINYGFHIIAEFLTVICIFIFLMQTDALMAVSVIILGIVCMTLVQKFFRNKMRILGERSRKYGALQTKYMYEAYGGIKEILVMQRQNFFIDNYESALSEMQRSSIGQTVASESPAYIIEAICVVGIISAVGVRISGIANAVSYIPSLASFAMAAFRIMPSLGRITSSMNNFMYNCPAFNATYENLHEVEAADKESEINNKTLVRDQNSHEFSKKLKINDISWRYEGAKYEVIKNLSFEVNKGESIGIMGPSGAGKSTLMDLILGLLVPQKGQIVMDEENIYFMPKKWAKTIGYVPQAVYLIDDSIRNNVAFGIQYNDISDEKIWKALKAAQIDEFVRSLPQGLDTYVGERGVRFSGGQRQRIAIARALYYDPQILIFDEATSALDMDTEKAVMESIENLHGTKTIIIVAHRLSTIRGCDRIFEVRNGNVHLRNKSEIYI